jgi:DNA-binding winged helix-turn-helix (wHTH) protein
MILESRLMSTSYRFGSFRLDLETQLLLHNGEPTELGRRGTALLLVLLRQARRVVTKEALVEAAWAGMTMEMSNLTVQIAAIRRVLRAEPGGEGWIETRTGRGYRFVGPEVITNEMASPVGRTGGSDSGKAPKKLAWPSVWTEPPSA